MKEFEKWLEKQKPYDPYCCAAMAESVWKAALEWVKDKLDEGFVLGLEDIIDKELNNE